MTKLKRPIPKDRFLVSQVMSAMLNTTCGLILGFILSDVIFSGKQVNHQQLIMFTILYLIKSIIDGFLIIDLKEHLEHVELYGEPKQ